MLNEKCKTKTINFKVIPDICREQGRTITNNKKEKKIHFCRCNVIPKETSKIKKYANSHNSRNSTMPSRLLRVHMDHNLLAHLPSSVLSTDGSTLITDCEMILDRWTGHFNSVLNRSSSIDDEAIVHLSKGKINVALGADAAVTEVEKAIKQISCNKAPGSAAILAKIDKTG